MDELKQMLQAGGVPVLADEHRPADESNQRGYLEFEPAKKLARDATWLGEARGRAVKLVAQLVPSLPREHRYRIVMMHQGAVAEEGTHDALMDLKGRYYALFLQQEAA